MKKKIISVILALSLAGSLWGCGDNADDNAAAKTASSSAEAAEQPKEQNGGAENEPVTLKWALWSYEQQPFWSALIEGYKEVAPHVTIEPVDLGSTDYSNMAQTQLTGGMDLDLVTIKDMPGYANLVAQDNLEPLNAYIDAAGIDTGIFSGDVAAQTSVDGELYELPFRSDFWVVFYNKDLFDAAGVAYPSNDMTLEEYDELARKLVSGSGNDKVYGAHYHTWRSAAQLFGILDGQHSVVDGGDYSWLKPYYEIILKEQEDEIVMDYSTAVSTSSHYRDLFYNGKIAMMNMGSWHIGAQIAAVRDGQTDVKNWGIVKYPHPQGVKPGTTLGTITGLSVGVHSAQKEEAFKFIAWATGSEGAACVTKTGTFPAILDDATLEVIKDLPGFPQDENSKAALAVEKIYLEMPYHPQVGSIEVILNEEHTEIMSGSKSIDEGLSAIETRIGELE